MGNDLHTQLLVDARAGVLHEIAAHVAPRVDTTNGGNSRAKRNSSRRFQEEGSVSNKPLPHSACRLLFDWVVEWIVDQVFASRGVEMNALTIGLQPEDRVLSSHPAEESLVNDSRAGMTPAQMVEHKLIGLLRGKALPVSQMLAAALQRGHC
jgi:hypothetical protein